MVDFTVRMLESWHDGEVRDVQDEMMRLTLEIVAKTLFDAEIAGDTAHARAAMETLMRSFVARTGSLLAPPSTTQSTSSMCTPHSMPNT